MCACVYVHAQMCVCVHMFMCAFVHACVCLVQSSKCQPSYIYPYKFVSVCVGVANLYERFHIGYVRSWAASECLKQIKGDDLFTHCISIGPVSDFLYGCCLVMLLVESV